MRHAGRSLSFAVSLIASVVFGGPGLSAEEKSAASPPNLAGRWTLDPEKSDDPRQKMRETRGGGEGGPGSEEGGQRRGGPGGGMGGRGGGGGGGGGRGGGMGGPGMGGGRPPGGPDGEESRESIRELLQAAPELLITPTTNEIVILEKDGRLRTLHPDGKTYKSDGGSSEVKTRWEGGGLVVESKMASGMRVVETFALVSSEPAPNDPKAPERKMLKVTVRIDGSPRSAIELKRVYQLGGSPGE